MEAQEHRPQETSAANTDYEKQNSNGVEISLPQETENRPNLRLQIPPRSLDISEGSAGKPPLSPSSAKSIRRTTRPSFKSRCTTPPPTRLSPAYTATSSSSSCTAWGFSKPQNQPSSENSHSSSSFPLPKMFHSTARRTTSLPVTPLSDSLDASNGAQAAESVNETISAELLAAKFERSLSLPLKKSPRSLKKSNAVLAGGFMLVRAATPPKEMSPPSTKGEEERGQEIPVEQAVCRICMDELGEGGSTFKMECSCRGELAFAHEDCAVKWFGIRGNKNCDVCGKDVQNLPVMLTRLPDDAGARQQLSRLNTMQGRLWQDVPVLIMISMLAYFCLLEQLLVRDMGSGALAIALPFACVLGLLASITASTLVSRKYIWGYAALQFGLVILFAHIFYNVMPRMFQVRVEAVLSILLSAFAGFGITMGVNGLCLEYISWRDSSAAGPVEERQDIELGRRPQQQIN